MPDDKGTPVEPEAAAPDAVPSVEAEDTAAGDKRAVLADLARERKARQKLERELKALEAQSQTEAEKAIAAARAEGRTEALSVANTRIVKAELKAAAAGVLQDPDDAVALIPLEMFEVDGDGDIDTKAVKAEVARLAKAKPYLAVGAKPTALPGGGATPSQGSTMDDALRAAIRGGGGRL